MKQVSIRIFFLSLVALLVLVIYSIIPLSTPQSTPHETSSPDALVARLGDMEPGTTEAQQIRANLYRLRKKAKKTEPDAENPGLLLEAFAQIKTTLDGRTYRPNYKIAALQAARAQSVGKTSELLPWVERGPGNVAGRTRAVIVDQSDPSGNTWWAATIGGGVWVTTAVPWRSDAGATWADKTPLLTTLTTSTLVQAPSNPDVFYLGTGMGYGRVVDLQGSGIWKSTDHGETWFQLESTTNGELLEAVNRIVVDPEDENIVLACTNDSFSHLGVEEGPRKSGIYRSTDGGSSWTQVFDPLPVFGPGTDNRVQQIIADPSDFNNLYTTVNEIGVIKSTNGGRTWSVSADNFALPSDIGNPPNGGFGLAGISVRTEIAIAPTDPNRIYAAVERPRGIADLYMSKDVGESWLLVPDTGSDPNWFNSSGSSGATGAYTAGWFDNTIAVHPFDEDIVFVGGVQLYRIVVNPNTNTRRAIQIASGGSSNNQPNLPYVHPAHHFLTMIPDNPELGLFRILNANDGGVALSPDGGVNWLQFAGMGSTQFYGADKKPGESAYLGGTQDNGTWISGANPDDRSIWQHVIGGDGFEVVWSYADSDLVLGGSQGNVLSRSTDGGRTWVPISGFPSPPNRSPFITKLANSKADPDLVFAVSMDGIIRTDDFGASWTVTPIQGNWLGWRPFDNVEISNADPQIVWISGRMDVDPASGLRGGIHVSTDGGLSFSEISNNFPPALAEASGIGTHPTDPNTAYMLFAGPGEPKVLQTTDLGQSWEDLSGFSGPAKSASDVSSNGFPDVAVFSLLVMPYNSNILWAGTEIGLFESTDGGQSWHMADNGFPNVAIFELSIMESKTITVSVISFLDGKTYRSPSRFLDVFPAVATTTYVNDLGDPDAASDFIGTGFSVMQPVGFTNAAIHSAHPYPNATDALYQLKVPIEVARGNAILRYEDIALIETGTAVDYTDPNFFDFVIVEGTTDGINWIPLAPGYDARADNIWAQAYVSGLQAGTIDSQTPGDPSMYVRHEMNLLDTFERGDIIFIRFRLHADPLAVAWGWAIDNISIQPNAIVSTEAGDLPASFELGQNYPNPFNPTTTIPFRLEQPALVSLSIYDTAGRTVRTLLDHQARQAGSHVYTFDASELPSGMYLYRIAVTPINGSRSIVRTQTMTLIK